MLTTFVISLLDLPCIRDELISGSELVSDSCCWLQVQAVSAELPN